MDLAEIVVHCGVRRRGRECRVMSNLEMSALVNTFGELFCGKSEKEDGSVIYVVSTICAFSFEPVFIYFSRFFLNQSLEIVYNLTK